MILAFQDKILPEVDSEKTILENFKIAGYTVTHSCMIGRCSECKVKVVKGITDMPINQEALTEQEISQGYCLSCISKPKSDLILEDINLIDCDLPDVKILPAKIDEIRFLSEEVVKINLRTPPTNSLEFLAGQYINLIHRNLKRSYSIASSPSNKKIELIIKKHSHGRFSNYLFNEAKVNDLIRIEGPKGTYILPSVKEEYILFVSTGTGIAPNLSILNYILENNLIKPENITLIHGQRYLKEHVYDLKKLFPKIKIIEAISREEASGFFHGYVQNTIEDLNLNLSQTQVFTCGNTNMITDVKNKLLELGLKASNFKSEIFIPSN